MFSFFLHFISMNVQDLWCHRPFSNRILDVKSILLCFFFCHLSPIQHPIRTFIRIKFFLWFFCNSSLLLNMRCYIVLIFDCIILFGEIRNGKSFIKQKCKYAFKRQLKSEFGRELFDDKNIKQTFGIINQKFSDWLELWTGPQY